MWRRLAARWQHCGLCRANLQDGCQTALYMGTNAPKQQSNHRTKILAWCLAGMSSILGVSFIYRKTQGRKKKITLQEAIEKSRAILLKVKEESGCPGVSVAVSVNGQEIWAEGIGVADVENNVPCHPWTVMKIASLSKPLTAAVVFKMVEMGRIKLDTPVDNYVQQWPQKTWNGEKVNITLRQLLSHKGGVRDYRKLASTPEGSTSDTEEFQFAEYHIKEKYDSVTESLKLFKDDALLSRPGTQFQYTTHGFTLISAALEGATGYSFSKLVHGLFKDLDLKHTHLDEKDKLVYHRASYYKLNREGELVNAPFSESSFRWAGAGLLYTVQDLVKFGDILLYSSQCSHDDVSPRTPDAKLQTRKANVSSPMKHSKEIGEARLPGYLTANTVKLMWTPVAQTRVSWHAEGTYGMGFQIIPYKSQWTAHKGFAVGHTGGTVGASSAMLISPAKVEGRTSSCPPQGVVVAILMNIQGVKLGPVALKIVDIFHRVKLS